MAKSFKELVARTGNAKTRQIAERRTRELVAEMIVSEIREALGKTQTQVAREAGMKQPSLAKLEAQSDMLISTLRKVMKAMGGELEVAVRFPQGRVRLKQFELTPYSQIVRDVARERAAQSKKRPAKAT
jgi:transcriptional regulator with XRE-family HTH domain